MPAISQGPCRRLPAFCFDYRLTRADRLQSSGLDPQCIQQTCYSRVGWTPSAYSRPVTAEWVGHSVYTADRLQPSGLDTPCIQQTVTAEWVGHSVFTEVFMADHNHPNYTGEHSYTHTITASRIENVK